LNNVLGIVGERRIHPAKIMHSSELRRLVTNTLSLQLRDRIQL
jgi:hypothetical protein